MGELPITHLLVFDGQHIFRNDQGSICKTIVNRLNSKLQILFFIPPHFIKSDCLFVSQCLCTVGLLLTFTFSDAYIALILLYSIQNFPIGLKNILVLLCSLILQTWNKKVFKMKEIFFSFKQDPKSQKSPQLIKKIQRGIKVQSGDLHCLTALYDPFPEFPELHVTP